MSERIARPTVALLCRGAALATFGGAAAYLLFGADKALGIFVVLVAAIVSRILILDVAERS